MRRHGLHDDQWDRIKALLPGRPGWVGVSAADRTGPMTGIAAKSATLIATLFAKLKQFRAIATRYHKTACNFLAAVYLAAGAIWLM